MSAITISAKKLFEAYKTWVSENPQTVGDFETTFKWASYFLAGRISNSSITTELIYSLSNLLALLNDRIIEKAMCVNPLVNDVVYKMKLMLTTLEFCEVFIEITANKLWGQKGRWFFITIIQITKSIGRFYLLQKSRNCIITTPPISALDRKNVNKSIEENDQVGEIEGSKFFKLRSGKVIRRINGAPPPNERDFTTPVYFDPHRKKKILSKAESLFIAKPILHLGTIGLFGYKSWKSYGVALILDIASIRIYYENRHLLTDKQKLILSRRCVNLLLYLVKSPFYESKAQYCINKILKGAAHSIPFAKSICTPILQYIPHWQETYFYMWST
ncbi:peroxisomal membrane protein PEX16 [Condylostylus longicornis]|uniref:peroxisomal membrane protein PEX16 n=1 Tax=Condylostylus longicornis TaxID=2530218 RepID=UPI00244E097C|nr:peroxisomal membrane protein PEX16 [Condylostylus longicornis]